VKRGLKVLAMTSTAAFALRSVVFITPPRQQAAGSSRQLTVKWRGSIGLLLSSSVRPYAARLSFVQARLRISDAEVPHGKQASSCSRHVNWKQSRLLRVYIMALLTKSCSMTDAKQSDEDIFAKTLSDVRAFIRTKAKTGPTYGLTR